jgi:hypothetical protein
MDISALQDARPSYVAFERRAVEDRAASMVAGMYKTRDVDFAVITPAGSKDRIERVAAEWFPMLEQQVKESRLPQPWFEAYQRQYEAFKKGEELPLNGTPIRGWLVASPSQQRTLIDLHILTVEDMAGATAEAMQAIGMGSIALKQKAKAWLDSAEQGKSSEALAGLKVENETLKAQITEEREKRGELERRILALEKPSK